MTERYLAVDLPEWKLVFDEMPPKGVSLHLLMEYGSCIKGAYDPAWGVVAWRELPKLTPEQKRRMMALEAAGFDLKKHRSQQNAGIGLSGDGDANRETGDVGAGTFSCVPGPRR